MYIPILTILQKVTGGGENWPYAGYKSDCRLSPANLLASLFSELNLLLSTCYEYHSKTTPPVFWALVAI
jgi:hypothetical protein